MNIFNNARSFVGELDYEHLQNATKEFWKQAVFIRKQLGTRNYLLTNYLELLFEAVDEPHFFEIAEEGESELSKFRGTIAAIKKGKKKDHPLHEKVKSYVEDYPVRYQENRTRYNLYLVGLADEAFVRAAPRFIEDGSDLIKGRIDVVQIQQLYDNISQLLGEEAPIERLNELFRQRFIITTSTSIFLQGFNSNLISILNTRDAETAKLIFQLYLEDVEEF